MFPVPGRGRRGHPGRGRARDVTGREATHRARLCLSDGPGTLQRLAAWVARCADRGVIPADFVFPVNLVLDELVTNALTHGRAGGGGDPHPRIELAAERMPGAVVLTLCDNGAPFDPTGVAPPDLASPLAGRQIGGLGLHFVHQFMDEVTYRRDGAHNRLTLTKRVPAPRPGA